jgi:hypothetical protein
MGVNADVGRRTLTDIQATTLAAAYDKPAGENLEPLACLDIDPIRRRIDEALATQ